ncbi:hypothetical protein LXL04_010180 [Taraxacum kok-saghyz]
MSQPRSSQFSAYNRRLPATDAREDSSIDINISQLPTIEDGDDNIVDTGRFIYGMITAGTQFVLPGFKVITQAVQPPYVLIMKDLPFIFSVVMLLIHETINNFKGYTSTETVNSYRKLCRIFNRCGLALLVAEVLADHISRWSQEKANTYTILVPLGIYVVAVILVLCRTWYLRGRG